MVPQRSLPMLPCDGIRRVQSHHVVHDQALPVRQQTPRIPQRALHGQHARHGHGLEGDEAVLLRDFGRIRSRAGVPRSAVYGVDKAPLDQHVDQHVGARAGQSFLQRGGGLVGPDGEARRGGLRQHHALVEALRVQRLHAHACVGALLQHGMLDRGGAAQVGEQRRVHVEAAVAGEGQDARGHEQAEGDGDDEVVGGGGRPACEGVEGVGGQGVGGGCGADGDCVR